ncbi:hypothetical protein DXG03_006860 [Asterophora parasitica]|uniref:F-box domain-containing protein n=1 Tax=Asterophora parasitica TaxID=117018 RepID=A0A9P7G7W2_9AGAR|nr:hypothetical protein DXG03_006860 [Asterophora parasitica]
MDNSELPTAFSSLAVREAAYSQLQDEMAAAELTLLSCRRRHNNLSLIFRLPPEILAVIFELVRVPQYTGNLRWIGTVSHICSRLRHVALQCPSLWSDIPFNYREWAQEMLARSKMAPLNVIVRDELRYYTRLGKSRLAPVVKAAVLELSHIKNLHLSSADLVGDAGYKEIIELLDAPAPFLETIDITNANLPVNLFAGVSPHLSSLVLSTCAFDVRPPIVANLQTLRLYQCHAPTDGKIPIDHFISALSTMTRLTTLHVIDSLDHRGVTAHPSAQQVAELPHLTELSIGTLVSNCIFLLDHIVYPSFTRVSVKYQTDVPGTNDNISVVRRLAEKLGSRVPGPIRSVELDVQGIRTLTLDRPFSLKLLKTHFGQLGHLTTIFAGNRATTSVISVLADGLSRKKSATRAAKPSFRTLETLGIEGWDFEETRHGFENMVFRELKTCLAKRKKVGVPLARLIIDECFHVDEVLYVEPLRTAVGDVQWDGETNYTELEYDDEDDFNSDGYSF